MRFTGCLAPNVDITGVTCDSAPTVDTDQPLRYRHLAVDADSDVLYFCDRDPGRPMRANTCFGSDRKRTDTKWTGEKEHCRTLFCEISLSAPVGF